MGARKISVTTLNTFCDSVVWNNFCTTNDKDDCIGRIIAVDNDGNYNPETPTNRLATLDQMRDRYRLFSVAIAALEQMRIIYSNYKSTTITFEVTIARLAASRQISLTSPLNDELTRFNLIKDTLLTAPYCSVRGRVPEAFQVKEFVGIAYLGDKYYERNLKTDAERTEWKNYRTSEVKQHISSADLADICDLLAASFPLNSMLLIAELIEGKTLKEAEMLMASRTHDEEQEVFHLFQAQGSDSAWYQEKLALKLEAQRLKTRNEVMDIIEKQCARTVNKKQMDISMTPDMDEANL